MEGAVRRAKGTERIAYDRVFNGTYRVVCKQDLIKAIVVLLSK